MSRILAADDSASMRQMVTFTLRGAGFDVTEAVDGVDALKKAKAEAFDLVLSDVNMPNMDGLDLLLALKKKKHTQRIGFILMSGQPDANINDLGKRIGMNNFIKKPFSDMEMKRCLEAVTGPLT